jgi:hypothetical protein
MAAVAQALASPALGQGLGHAAHRSHGAVRQQITVTKDVRLGMGSVRHRLLLQRKSRRMDAAVHSMEVKPVRVRPLATAAPNTGQNRLAEITDAT